MDNGLGIPQTIALFGATSEIGQAIVREIIETGVSNVILAARNPENAGEFANEISALYPGVKVDKVAFDAANFASHAEVVADVARRHGDIDLAVVAFGLLGTEPSTGASVNEIVEVAQVNFTGTVTLLKALSDQMRAQRHGRIVYLSSVAGERVRLSNPVYGSSKAGADGYAQGLADAVANDGVKILIVRPGFVASKMTAHLKPAPFATTPGAVASATAKALRRERVIVWVPGLLRWVFVIFRHLPLAVWRKVSAKG